MTTRHRRRRLNSINPKTGLRNRIAGTFTAIPTEVMESPAWWVLSLVARRVLDRLCLELGYNAGRNSAKLCVTYQDFVDYGITNRHCITAAVRELVALGFVRITRVGRAGNAEFRLATCYRLTFVNNTDGEPLTNEWKRIQTLAEAKRIALEARQLRKARKQNPGVQNDTELRCQNDTENVFSPGVQNDTTARCTNDTTIYTLQGGRLGGRLAVGSSAHGMASSVRGVSPAHRVASDRGEACIPRRVRSSRVRV
jgi:hypothetical protein